MMKSEILKKLAELATELDANGFYSEADAVDEIIKSAWGESPMPAGSGAGGLPQVGPYEDPEAHARMTKEQLQQFRAQHQKMQFPGAEITGKPLQHTKRKLAPRKDILDFQKRYNTALQTLQNMGADISSVEPYLKIDGLEGPHTKSAYKSWATIRELLQTTKQPSEVEQRTGLTPETMKQQQLQKTIDSHTFATGLYRQLMKQHPELGTKWTQEKIRGAINSMVQKGMTAEQAAAAFRTHFGLR